jgi:hypothetical protein
MSIKPIAWCCNAYPHAQEAEYAQGQACDQAVGALRPWPLPNIYRLIPAPTKQIRPWQYDMNRNELTL